ncbi:MAG: hypothetical protein WAQ25_02455 [Candidatus Saccharimonas sp.]
MSIQPTPQTIDIKSRRMPRTKWGVRRRHRQSMRETKQLGRAAERDMRRILAAAELPAGRAARVNHRAGQIAELATTVVTIVTAIVTVREALRRPAPEQSTVDPPVDET